MGKSEHQRRPPAIAGGRMFARLRLMTIAVASLALLVTTCLAHIAGGANPYLGVGANASALKRIGVIGNRAGYENDTFLSNEVPMLTTWPEDAVERDFFRP